MFWRSMALKQYYQHPLSLSPPPHHACLWPAQIGYLYPLECTERSDRFWGGHRPSTRHTTVNVLRSALQGLWINDMIINSHSRIVDSASLTGVFAFVQAHHLIRFCIFLKRNELFMWTSTLGRSRGNHSLIVIGYKMISILDMTQAYD